MIINVVAFGDQSHMRKFISIDDLIIYLLLTDKVEPLTIRDIVDFLIDRKDQKDDPT